MVSENSYNSQLFIVNHKKRYYLGCIYFNSDELKFLNKFSSIF